VLVILRGCDPVDEVVLMVELLLVIINDQPELPVHVFLTMSVSPFRY